jgi:hypothetical protein
VRWSEGSSCEGIGYAVGETYSDRWEQSSVDGTNTLLPNLTAWCFNELSGSLIIMPPVLGSLLSIRSEINNFASPGGRLVSIKSGCKGFGREVGESPRVMGEDPDPRTPYHLPATISAGAH